ncbi:restriction endonuclease subunit S [Nitrospira sp. M1]
MKQETPRKRLGDLFDFKNGRAFKKEEWSTSGLPIIRIQNLNREDAPFNYFAGKYNQDILVEPGDLLFSWSGTVGSSFGSHLWSGQRGVLNQHIFKIGLHKGIAKRYAFHALRHITEEIEQSVSGAVGIVHITKEKLNEFTIPAPSLPEQQRIVGILDEAFEGIATAKANAGKNLQNARALFDSPLHSIFTKRGKGWAQKRLNEVCAITSTLVDPRKNDFFDLVHVGTGNIESKTGVFVGLKTSREEGLVSGKFLFDKSMVLYSKIRPYLMKVARADFHGLCSADMYPLTPLPNQITRDYLFHLLLSKPFTDYAIQGSARAGIPKVNREHLFEFMVWLPTVTKQKEIAASLDVLHLETQRLESIYQQKLAALDELKKSLLHQAFSGQL